MGASQHYDHDCDDCIGLGRYNFSNRDRPLGKDYDLYFCPRSDGGSVIARYGSAPSAYMSTPLDILEPRLQAQSPQVYPLLPTTEAYRRVLEFGLRGDAATRRTGRYHA